MRFRRHVLASNIRSNIASGAGPQAALAKLLTNIDKAG
jgi:hypothetical protein